MGLKGAIVSVSVVVSVVGSVVMWGQRGTAVVWASFPEAEATIFLSGAAGS